MPRECLQHTGWCSVFHLSSPAGSKNPVACTRLHELWVYFLWKHSSACRPSCVFYIFCVFGSGTGRGEGSHCELVCWLTEWIYRSLGLFGRFQISFAQLAWLALHQYLSMWLYQIKSRDSSMHLWLALSFYIRAVEDTPTHNIAPQPQRITECVLWLYDLAEADPRLASSPCSVRPTATGKRASPLKL